MSSAHPACCFCMLCMWARGTASYFVSLLLEPLPGKSEENACQSFAASRGSCKAWKCARNVGFPVAVSLWHSQMRALLKSSAGWWSAEGWAWWSRIFPVAPAVPNVPTLFSLLEMSYGRLKGC